MNTISLLLGLMSVLLIGSFAWIFTSMAANTRPEDTQALEAEIRSLRAEMAQLDQMRVSSYQPNLPAAPAVATAPVTTAMPANSMPTLPAPDAEPLLSAEEQEAADLAAMKAEQEALAATDMKDEGLSEVDTFSEEDSMPPAEMVVDEAQMSRRAKMIRNALLTAKITEVSKEEGYAGIQIIRQNGVLEEQILAVRRGDGIAGRVRVTKLYGAGVAVIDPIPGSFLGGNPTLQVGDELIVPTFN